MKRTPLRRYTPLTSKGGGMKRTPMKRSVTNAKASKTRKKAPPSPARLKTRLWELCKQITRKTHGYNCFTCGNHSDAPHTGHFISSSVCSGLLRYDLRNLRPQCYRCNIHLSGNWPAYERRLISEFGEEYVKNLKNENEQTKGQKYNSIFYQSKIAEYTELLKTL